MRAAPSPKLASVTGAYTAASRAPNWFRTAAVATTTSDPSRSARDGDGTSSRAAGAPRACKTAHMAGSQVTMALALTWLATQAAARCRAPAAAASAGRPAPCPAGPAAPDSATAAAPATKITATSPATTTTHHRACTGHQRPSRRCAHNRTVVASTEPQDGSGALGFLAGPGVPARTGGGTSPGFPDGSGRLNAASRLPREGAAPGSPAEP